MLRDKTIMFPVGEDREVNTRITLAKVYQALEKKGYNPISQIVGYVLSGDPTYITNYDNARMDMSSLDRHELLQTLIKFYLSN